MFPSSQRNWPVARRPRDPSARCIPLTWGPEGKAPSRCWQTTNGLRMRRVIRVHVAAHLAGLRSHRLTICSCQRYRRARDCENQRSDQKCRCVGRGRDAPSELEQQLLGAWDRPLGLVGARIPGPALVLLRRSSTSFLWVLRRPGWCRCCRGPGQLVFQMAVPGWPCARRVRCRPGCAR